MTDEEWLEAINSTGTAFDNDFDDSMNGKFGFTVTDNGPNRAPVLTATFTRVLDEGEPRENNGDYAQPVTQRWLMLPIRQEFVSGPPTTEKIHTRATARIPLDLA